MWYCANHSNANVMSGIISCTLGLDTWSSPWYNAGALVCSWTLWTLGGDAMTKRKSKPAETETGSPPAGEQGSGADLFGSPVSVSARAWTSGELAAAGRVNASRIRQLCISGRFPGARKFGRDWLIPDDAAQVWLTVDRDRRRKESRRG